MPAAPLSVLVAGGGPAAVETVLALRDLAGERVALRLLAPEPELLLRPFEVLAPFREGRTRRCALQRVAADAGATLELDALARVDAAAHRAITRSGHQHPYDALVVAVGARQVPAVAGAAPFRGARDAGPLKTLLADVRSGRHPRVAFAVPGGVTWPLPIYELALQTAGRLAEDDVSGVELALVTPEPAPLALFGARASGDVAALLDRHGIRFVRGQPIRLHDGELQLLDGTSVPADRAIALPRLLGRRIDGLPADADGFVPVDEFGRVPGAEGVFAAGDATTSPVKQGGLATQQADAIAERIAADAGAPVEPRPFRPVLRGLLLGGRERRFLTDEPDGAAGPSPEDKLTARYLGRYLHADSHPA